MLPVVPSLANGSVDLNDFLVLIAKELAQVFLTTQRYAYFAFHGVVGLGVGWHDNQELCGFSNIITRQMESFCDRLRMDFVAEIVQIDHGLHSSRYTSRADAIRGGTSTVAL